MHRQGGQWIVSSWDEHVRCYRESAPMSYQQARARVGRENRGERD